MEDKAKTPGGKAEQVRTRRSASEEEAQRSPAESNSGVTSGPYQRLYPIYPYLD
ncbi:hypothetical protein ABEW47_17735 [Priestia megaterium]